MSTHRVPPIRLHRASGQAYVWLSGRRIYLGRYGLPETRQKYLRVLAEWAAGGQQLPAPSDLTVTELCDRFLTWARGYYRNGEGVPTAEAEHIALAQRPVVRLYGHTLAKDFGPRALRTVQEAMVSAGLARMNINRRVSRIKRMFRWAVAEELVPPSVYHGLQAVAGLKFGRSDAKETEPVRPVPEAHVEAIRPYVSAQVWAIVRLQLLTAARPGELLQMRPRDIEMGGRVWLYRPRSHKGQYRGRERTIYCGPRAQAILKPFLAGRATDAYMFAPSEAEHDRLAKRHAARRTPISCGNRPGTNRSKSPNRRPGDCYTVDSYRRAIHRACEAAGVPAWHPHQLRHNCGTLLRKTYGLEAAQLILGHAKCDVTQLYSELNRERAVELAARIG